jgi:hypothetical protein
MATGSTSPREGFYVSPSRKWGRIGLLLAVLLALGGMATSHSYLVPSIVDRAGMMLLVASALSAPVWVVLLSKWGAESNPGDSGLIPAGRVFIGTLVLSGMLAGFCVMLLQVSLLVAVKYGPSEPVKFHSLVTDISPVRGCWRWLTFPNTPLAREGHYCASGGPLKELKKGDRIVVEERLGSLGGTIFSVMPDPEEVTSPAPMSPAAARIVERVRDDILRCVQRGRRFEFASDADRAAFASGTFAPPGPKYRCE